MTLIFTYIKTSLQYKNKQPKKQTKIKEKKRVKMSFT